MAAAASSRVWASLTKEEAEEVNKAADTRGVRSSELVRMAVLFFIRQAPVGTAATVSGAIIPGRLEALVEILGRHVEAIGKAVPTMEDAWEEHEAVRGSLRDIAQAVGTLAGSIEPPHSGPTGGPF
ncbi:CopG family transcriptional regulator [Muricoccus aerilatus]|uniref:ribbon-helix-helix domain-containing protein n=1 Tax=Muricoccus aerilatus TaxID=452982 RepID=UPI0005C20F7F|nr:CopG family transcriptional regulator [Roseomonas aerilata]